MSTSRAKRTLAAVAATGMAAAVATIGLSSQAAATHKLSNSGSCTPTLKDPVPSPVVAGGTRIEWSVSCTGARSYEEEVVAEVLYPGTTTPTVVAKLYQLSASTGTADTTKILDVPVHISYACVTLDGHRYCSNDTP